MGTTPGEASFTLSELTKTGFPLEEKNIGPRETRGKKAGTFASKVIQT